MVEYQKDSASHMASAPMKTKSSWPLTFLKVGVSAAALVGVVMTVDLSAAWQRMASQNYWLLAAAAAIMAVQVGIGGLRWHIILKELGAPARVTTSVSVFWIAAFFNSWLWGTVGGDVLRAWLSHRARFGLPIAVNSVILDRAAAVVGAAILVLATAPLFVQHTGQFVLALIFSGVAVSGLLGIVIAAQIHHLPINWQRYRVLRGMHVFSVAARRVFLHPTSALPVLGLAVAAQTAGAVATYVMSVGLNVGLQFIDCIILMQPVALVTALPISVGGWGVRETAMIGLLSLVGISTSAALSLSVQMGLLMIIVTLPGAAFWILHKDSHS